MSKCRCLIKKKFVKVKSSIFKMPGMDFPTLPWGNLSSIFLTKRKRLKQRNEANAYITLANGTLS